MFFIRVVLTFLTGSIIDLWWMEPSRGSLRIIHHKFFIKFRFRLFVGHEIDCYDFPRESLNPFVLCIFVLKNNFLSMKMITISASPSNDVHLNIIKDLWKFTRFLQSSSLKRHQIKFPASWS